MSRTSVSSATSVLEAAEACSIQLPYECRSGICGQCKTQLMEGAVIDGLRGCAALLKRRTV